MPARLAEPRRLSLRAWAHENSVPYSSARRFARRVADPLPVLRIGRQLLVERSSGEAWLERESRRTELDVSQLVDRIVCELEAGSDA